MAECDGELKAKRAERTSVCTLCAASMSMWKKRGIRAIMLRRSKLKKYDSRMAQVSEIKAVTTKKKRA